MQEAGHDMEERLRARGFEPTRWTDPPGTIREQSVHEHDEILVVLNGSVEIDLGGLTRIPEVGEEVFIPALTVHTLRNVGDTDAVWIAGKRGGLRS